MNGLVENTTAVVTMVTTLATELFSIFPINIIIVMSLAGAALGLLRKGKKAAIR
jgi:hypothetical protein